MSLFKEQLMRQPNKAAITDYLTSLLLVQARKRKTSDLKGKQRKKVCLGKKADIETNNDEGEGSSSEQNEISDVNTTRLLPESNIVLDGGALLHKVVWRPNSSYKEMIQQYRSYVKNKYGICTIVFDGYGYGPSTKDHEHQRRIHNSKKSPEITIDASNTAYDRPTAFLSNESNNAQFVDLLSQHLASDVHTVKKSDGDADTLIMSSAVDVTCMNVPVVVFADDTDILVMLLRFCRFGEGEIIMLGETGVRQLIRLKEIAAKLDRAVLNNILQIHAWGGCDTTCTKI